MRLEEIVLELSKIKIDLQYHLDGLIEILKRTDELNDRLNKEDL